MIHEINALVLEYLLMNGHRAVAEQFVREARLPKVPAGDLDDVSSRAAVAQLVLDGMAEQAIGRLNELDVYFLEDNFDVYFDLLELRLLEMVRPGLAPEQCGPVLELASGVAQLVAGRDKYTPRLEKVMALVCYPASTLPHEYRELLGDGRRAAVAKRVNRALLEWRGAASQSRLERLLKLEAWIKAE